MTPAQIRLEAARMRQRADALMRLARWQEENTTTVRVMELSRQGADAATISTALHITKGAIYNIRTGLKRRGLIGKEYGCRPHCFS